MHSSVGNLKLVLGKSKKVEALCADNHLHDSDHHGRTSDVLDGLAFDDDRDEVGDFVTDVVVDALRLADRDTDTDTLVDFVGVTDRDIGPVTDDVGVSLRVVVREIEAVLDLDVETAALTVKLELTDGKVERVFVVVSVGVTV